MSNFIRKLFGRGDKRRGGHWRASYQPPTNYRGRPVR